VQFLILLPQKENEGGKINIQYLKHESEDREDKFRYLLIK